jgi:hypothetical protein
MQHQRFRTFRNRRRSHQLFRGFITIDNPPASIVTLAAMGHPYQATAHAAKGPCETGTQSPVAIMAAQPFDSSPEAGCQHQVPTDDEE